MAIDKLLSEGQLDFLTEMINIGGGNAATVFGQLFQSNVGIKVPEVYVVPDGNIYSLPFYNALPVACLRMLLLGDINGHLHVMINDSQRAYITRLADKKLSAVYKVTKDAINNTAEWNEFLLKEVANIFANAYLTAINTFCGLNIHHTLPKLKTGTAKSFLDEAITADNVIVVNSTLLISETPLEIITTIAFSREFVGKIKDAITEAMRRLGRKVTGITD